jgi:high-affinity nickel permease
MVHDGLAAAVAAATMLGFRHGVDYDHVAAIADLTGAADRPSRAVGLAILYGLGHATIVTILGAISIAFGAVLPKGTDQLLESLVGLTLVVLGSYVIGAVVRDGWRSRPATRLELIRRASCRVVSLFSLNRWTARKAAAELPGRHTAFGVGIIHGISAETPTQLGLFVLSAGVGGWGGGLLCVLTFAAGLLAMNTLMAFASAGMFHLSSLREPIYRGVMIATATYSIVVGALFILGGAGFSISI